MRVSAEHRTFGGFGDRSGANRLLFAELNAFFRTLSMQRLPGFRDFYPEDCATRNYLFENWRRVAKSFGFQEYDGPTLESTELYKRKSGEELKTQLFRFIDQGDRDVCMRPEMTPTLARLIAARAREFRKPIKWFSISPFFRFEKPQKGRLREFYQINCDIVGDDSPAADAELLGLAVALHRVFGLTEDDFFVRVNNRNLWADFLIKHQKSVDRLPEFLSIIDKLEREDEETTQRKLQSFQLDLSDIRAVSSRTARIGARLRRLVSRAAMARPGEICRAGPDDRPGP